jgi:hypothetical protein
MDKTSNVQYASNQFTRLKDGYKLTYKEADNRLNLVDKDGSIIFDVSLDEVADIYRARSFLDIKLKDNTRHFIGFGVILGSSKAAASQDSADLSSWEKMKSIDATMEDWAKLFKSKGVKGIKLKMPAAVKIIFYIAAIFFLIMMIIIRHAQLTQN